MWHYLKVNEDLTVSITSEPYKSERYAFRTMEGAIYPCETHDAIILSNEVCSIGGHNHLISSIRGVDLNEVDSLQEYQSDETVLIKDVKSKLPDPFTEKLAPFTSAVVLACLTKSSEVALTGSEHQRKMNIQRQLRLMIGTDDELSIKKATELLSYYGLSITDILADDLIVSKK